MLFLFAIILAIFSPTLFIPGVMLVFFGLTGMQGDAKGTMLVAASVGFLLVLASM